MPSCHTNHARTIEASSTEVPVFPWCQYVIQMNTHINAPESFKPNSLKDVAIFHLV